MAAKIGNIYISGAMTDRIEIPTANEGFSTTLNLKTVPGRLDNDRQPEMAA